MESTATIFGFSSRIVAAMTSTSVSDSTRKPACAIPSRLALRATCRGDSSPETIRHPSPRWPITCRRSVLFPTPGSPPTSTIEPGTIPPPRTLFSSPTPASIRFPPSVALTSSSENVLPPALFFCRVARSAKPTTFLLSRASSTNVLHSPQSGQRPSHFGSSWPQLEQTKSVLVAMPQLYGMEAKIRIREGPGRVPRPSCSFSAFLTRTRPRRLPGLGDLDVDYGLALGYLLVGGDAPETLASGRCSP